MNRFMAPVVSFAAAGYVASVNIGADEMVLTFIGIDRLVGPDLVAQGRLTWQLLIAFGFLTLFIAVRSGRRSERDTE
jgi:hypothetical protein